MSIKFVGATEFSVMQQEHSKWLSSRKGHIANEGTRISISEKRFEGLSQLDTSFAHAEFIGCRFRNSRFVNCNFNRATLYACTFEMCEFIQCNFHKAEIHSSVCSGVNFSKSSFSRSKINDSVLMFADLSGADLTATWFYKADLRFVNFGDAILDQTAFHDVRLYTNTPQIVKSLSQVKIIDDLYIDLAGQQKLKRTEGNNPLDRFFSLSP